MVWANPVSLAATQGIAIAFSSSGYLDVSVPRVCLQYPMYSGKDTIPLRDSGFPHSEISGSKLTYSSPKHIGVSPVLHRLLVPRHSPCALSNLTMLKSLNMMNLLGSILSFFIILSSFQRTITKWFVISTDSHEKITPSKLNKQKTSS